MVDQKEIDDVFNDFWKEIVCNPDGSINVDQLKKELFDFHNILERVPEVYCHVTGGKLSKPGYPSSVVISEADGHMDDMILDAVNDEYEELIMRWPELEEICPKKQPDTGWRTWFMNNISRIGGDGSCLTIHRGDNPNA